MLDLSIKRFAVENAEDLSKLLSNDNPKYGQYFFPFDHDSECIADRLKMSRDDCYWGVWLGSDLAGFFMLRGFDEGYSRPSFGVYIARRFCDRGLSSLALDYAVSWCRLNGVAEMMLKVHPENAHAKSVYEKAGFRFIETCPKTGHYTMIKNLD